MLYLSGPQKDAAFFYYYWQPDDTPVWENSIHPIICSIATLRYFCRRVPIYVIDASPGTPNWGNYPQDFSFTVLPRKPFLSEFQVSWDRFGYFSMLVCSKVFDIYLAAQAVAQRKILVSDADVFWVSNPFPFEYDRGFCTDGHNTGFWYYHKDDTKYLGMVLSLLFGSIVSSEMAQQIFQESNSGQNIFLEETVFRFLCSRVPQYNRISSRENYLLPYFAESHNFARAKNLHILGYMSERNRLFVASYITELADIFDAMFPPTQRKEIFGVRPETTYSCRDPKAMLELLVKIYGPKEKWH